MTRLEDAAETWQRIRDAAARRHRLLADLVELLAVAVAAFLGTGAAFLLLALLTRLF